MDSKTTNRRQFAAMGAVGILGSLLLGESNSVEVRVHIDPNRVLGQTPDNFLGFGYEISSVAVKGLLARKNHTLLQYYRNLGKEGVVRIGGNTADFASWSPEGQAVSAPKATVINRSVLADLGEFLHAIGWKLIWNLNLGSGSAESAAEEAIAVAAAAEDRLLCFQIGNEPDLFARSGHRAESYGYPEYHREFARFVSVLRKRLPDVPIGGPDVARAMQWASWFAADEAQSIKLLTAHYYRASQRQPAANFDSLLHADPQFLSRIRELRAVSRRYQVPYRLTEVNSFSGGGKPGLSDTFASALWALDLLFTLSFYEAAGLNLETGINQLGFVSSYSPIFDDQRGNLTARPSYYAMLAFSMAGLGKRIHTDIISKGMNVTAYASVDKWSRTWITCINKEIVNDVHVLLSCESRFKSAKAMRLTAPSFDAKTGTTLAEAEVSPEGFWKPKHLEKLKHNRRQIILDLPRSSAALIQLI